MTDEPEQKQPELVAVRIIGQRGKSALIETDDHKRWFVPTSKAKSGQVDAETLDKAILHGVPWEDYLDLSALTPDALALQLRQSGIHTVDDLQQKDRRLIRIGTNLIGQAVQGAAKRAAEVKPPRRKR